MSAYYISPDGSRLTTILPATTAGQAWQTVQIWDVASRRVHASFPIPWLHRHLPGGDISNYFTHFTQSPRGRYLVLADADRGTVTLWHADTGAVHAVWPGRYALVSDDEQMVAIVAPDARSVQLRDVGCGRELANIPARLPEGSPVQKRAYHPLAFTAHGHWLAIADGAEVRLWGVTTGRPGATLRGHTQPVRAVAFAPDAALLASRAEVPADGVGGWEDRLELRLWEVATARPCQALELACPGIGPDVVQFSADGKKLRLNHEYTYRVTDLLTHAPTPPGGADPTPGLENCPDRDRHGAVAATTKSGRWAARCNRQTNTVELVTADTTLPLPGSAHGDVGQLVFSPDERMLAIGGVTGGPLPAPGWFAQLLESARVLPAPAPEQRVVELWEVPSQRLRATLPGFFAGFSADSSAVLTCHIGEDSDRLAVWDFPPRPPFALMSTISAIAALLAALFVGAGLDWRRRARRRAMVPRMAVPGTGRTAGVGRSDHP